MSNVIIAIHGLGNKPPKDLLHKWGIMAIEEGIKSANKNIDLPELELVYWADIVYDKPLDPNDKNTKSPTFFEEPYVKSPKRLKAKTHEVRQKIVDWIIKLTHAIFLKKDYELRYSFLSQRLFHNYYHELEVYFSGNYSKKVDIHLQAKNKIINRLTEVLKKHHNDKVMLIAHSMGSIIAFDVLSHIARDTKINTFVTMGSPLGLPFIISRIAQQSKIVNQGHIKLQTPEGIYHRWYNLSDIEDKIALDYKLAEDFESNSNGVKVIDKLVTNNYIWKGIPNPHESYGYLRTSEFIDILEEFLSENNN